MENFKIKLTTLSPVCIGNGQRFVPITDYICSDKKIHYLNKKLINEELSENDSLMEKYINGIIYGMDNNRTDFNLKEFLEENLKLSVEEYTLFSVDASIKSAKELNCIIKNADNQPYIPGSSIKGAIKNIMAYYFLSKNENIVTDFIKKINNRYPDFEKKKGKLISDLQIERLGFKQEIKDIEEEINQLRDEIEGYKSAGFSKSQYKEDADNLEKAEKDLEEAKNDLKEVNKEADEYFKSWAKDVNLSSDFNFINKKINSFFVKVIEKNNDGTIIKEKSINNPAISDTSPFSMESLRVVDSDRIHLFNETDIPTVWETITSNSETNFSLKWEADSEISLTEFLKQVNEFAKKSIELDMLSLEHSKNAKNDFLKSYYSEMIKNLNQLTENQCILRLGFNKGVYFNSILVAIHQKDKSAFNKLLVLLGYKEYRKVLGDAIFPLTRGMASENNPLGWVKLEIIE